MAGEIDGPGGGSTPAPDPKLLRILDANRNRALEALRVIEEHARFVLSSGDLARRAKDLRHQVHMALQDVKDLALHRDVPGDPLHPDAPAARAGGPRAVRDTAEDVALANMGRAKEALRALEEYAKPVLPAAAIALERARYGVYALEKDLVHGARARERLGSLYLLIETKPGRPPLADQARAALRGGARLFQLREKHLADGARLAQARELVALVRGEGGTIIINDRPDLAALSLAHGVHVGQEDLPPAEARKLLPRGSLVGASAHDRSELERVLSQGIDYVGVGTVFASRTKPDLPARGLAVLQELVPLSTVPVYAIGGVGRENAASAIKAGAHGVAVSSSVLDATDIEKAVRELDEVVREARGHDPGGR